MPGSQRQLPPKNEVFRALLESTPSGWTATIVMVHLDPRREGVIVPDRFKGQPQLILEIGYQTNPPISDLEFEGDGISATLYFNRAPFLCKLPWLAIFALVTKAEGRGMLWPQDVPPEVAAQMQHAQQKAAPEAAPAPAFHAAPAPAALRSEPAAPTSGETGPEPDMAAGAKKKAARKPRPRSAAARAEAEHQAAAQPSAPEDAGNEQPPARRSVPAAASAAPASVGEPASPSPVSPPTPRPAPSAARAETGIEAGRKPKRELPSYLRVIK